jgi:glycosyltransferase involved in cell wall biosynthesis
MESKTILCIGSIQYLKGQDLLIEASKKLWDSGDYNFDLVLIGDVYESFGLKIMKMINKLKIDYPINYKKPVSPFMALKYIASADIIVLPSRTEALPRVILEGMALKKPIIASDVGGVSELIENNVQGLVFNAEDINQLSNYMEILLNDNLIKKNLSEKAHEKYWNFYSRKIYNKNWSNFLDRFD